MLPKCFYYYYYYYYFIYIYNFISYACICILIDWFFWVCLVIVAKWFNLNNWMWSGILMTFIALEYKYTIST